MSSTEKGVVSDIARGADWLDDGNNNFSRLRRFANAQWGNDLSTTSGLTYGYFGGTAWNGSAWTLVADGTVALTDNTTNYVERTVAGVVSKNTSGFTATSLPMAKVVTASGSISTHTDVRMPHVPGSASTPTGSAGGDLTGTYPNPTIKTDVALGGNPTTTTQSANNNSTRIATTAYVDAAVTAGVNGLSWKQAVRVATTTAGTLASSFENGDTVDGVTLATGNRILIKNQAAGAENGIYVVAASGAPSRAADADAGAELVNAAVFVSEGTTNADTQWVCTNNATPTLGSTALTFAQAGGGTTYSADESTLHLSSTTFSIKSGGVGPTELASTAVTPGTYGDGSHVAQFTVDSDGRLTAATQVAIPGVGTSGSGGPDICRGRLTLETGVAMSTSDQTGKTTVYFTPYKGANIALYSGSVWDVIAFSETSLALGTLTSGKNYDVFGYNNSGTLALELSAAWTNDTTRADALTLLDGIRVKSGATTRRYLGTFRTTSTTTTEDSAAKRFLWNEYNQLPRKMKNAAETTDTWNYTTATFRQANANTANQLDYVTGDAATFIEANVSAMVTSTAVNQAVVAGIGVDSTSTNSADVYGSNPTTLALVVFSTYRGNPGLGRHFLAWLEYSGASGTTTWYGDAGVPTTYQSGITGVIWN